MDQTTSAEHHGAPPDHKNDAHELSGDLQLQQNACAISAAAASTTTVDAPIVGAPHHTARISSAVVYADAECLLAYGDGTMGA